MVGKYRLATLGCKVNQYESQQVREVLEAFGLQETDREGSSILAVVNTCAVTAGAVRKSRRTIRRLADRGKTPVVVIGCGASAEAERFRRLQGVAAVYGHDADVRRELRAFLSAQFGDPVSKQVGGSNEPPSLRPTVGRNNGWMIQDASMAGRFTGALSSSNRHNHTRPLPIVKDGSLLVDGIATFHDRQRAFLKIQDGCDAFCSYCVIPRLRPALRSKPIDVALAEAGRLVQAGHKEIILTGIFLGAYGRETAVRKRWSARRSPLAALITALTSLDGLERLRLSSLEPGDVDDSLLDALASSPVCVPHLHLPLQSGSDPVLRRMNRQYTADQFLDMLDRVRGMLDRPAITTDIIVGFPGETEKDFRASLQLARYAGFCKIHAFPFSPRAGTAAARWHKLFLAPADVKERMQRLSALERELSISFRRRFLGDVERVIVERSHGRDELHSPHPDEDMGRDPSRLVHGRCDRYFEIHFEAGRMNPVQPGDIVRVRIDRITPTRTHGTCLNNTTGSYPLPVLSAV